MNKNIFLNYFGKMYAFFASTKKRDKKNKSFILNLKISKNSFFNKNALVISGQVALQRNTTLLTILKWTPL
jgi:hypothetical protein